MCCDQLVIRAFKEIEPTAGVWLSGKEPAYESRALCSVVTLKTRNRCCLMKVARLATSKGFHRVSLLLRE